MDVIAAYRDVGSYRGAAEICGTTHKTVRRIIEAHEAGGLLGAERSGTKLRPGERSGAQRVEKTSGRISAKRLLPQARAAGYAGSARNFRRLVAQAKAEWRRGHHRGRRPGVWAPGETLIIDWGVEAGLHVFCAVLAWSRFRLSGSSGSPLMRRLRPRSLCWPNASRPSAGCRRWCWRTVWAA